ncbi:amino acid adenylation domain-containing protein [uncultured Thalassospira sp.]|uniref:amino acid adenylation domain-containing protein n=1 Tax=uncultured Thalassospira sp. TaxID=404382 RepID=UPI0030DBDBDB
MIQSFIAELGELSVRLWLEDGQLRFSAPKGVVQGELRDQMVAQKADIIAYLDNQDAAPEIVPAAPMQEMLWSLCQQANDWPGLYIESRQVTLNGKIDVNVLERAINATISRHDALRTSFLAEPDGLKLGIARQLRIEIEQHDLIGGDTRQIEKTVRQLSWHSFDLENGPLIRIGLIIESETRSILILSQHHLITDRWSAGLLINEISERYDAILRNRSPKLPVLRSSYAEYAKAQRAALDTSRHAENSAYWRNLLAGIPDQLVLPYDRPYPAKPDYRGGRSTHTAAPSILQALAIYCRVQNLTPFMVACALQSAFLHRLTNQETIVIGTPVAGRLEPKYEDVAGYFVNTVALRTDPSSDMSFTALSEQIRSRALEAFDHQDMPFGHLVGDLPIDRKQPQPPVFQTMIAVQNVDGGTLKLGDITLEDREAPVETAKYPLMLTLIPDQAGTGNLVMHWDYQTALFDHQTIECLADCFTTFACDALENPQTPLADLTLLPDKLSMLIAAEAMPEPVAYPKDQSVWSLFDLQAKTTPESIALDDGTTSLIYRELHQQAEQLAVHLATRGVQKGDRIGLLLPRSIDLIVSQLAVLRLGATFIPLDPAYPEDRLAVMIDDAKPAIVIRETTISGSGFSSGICVLSSELSDNVNSDTSALPDHDAGADAIAYIMYTSGSTGRPKGVAVPHRGITRLVRGQSFIPFGPERVFLQLSSPSFDASTLEIWGALLHGAKLVLPPPGTDAFDQLGDIIDANKVDVLWLTSGLFSTLIDSNPAALRKIKYLLAGGDALSPAHVARALATLPSTQLINGYGPTENTTFTCCHRLDANALDKIIVGKPISNTTAHILDARGHITPPGVPGTLWTGGDGLADGYLDQPGLTAKNFVTKTVIYAAKSFTERLYCTGDLARWVDDPNGDGLVIEILGRADDQVKIRGFRVELAEIEIALEKLAAIGRATVIVSNPSSASEKSLIAFCIPANDKDALPTEASIKQTLAKTLPAYLVPERIGLLDTLPLTPNGKVDRKALLDMVENLPASFADRTIDFEAPASETEQELAKVWTDLFGLENVSRSDSFFSVGGNSLSAIRLVASYRDIRHTKNKPASLTIGDVFAAPVLSDLAARIDRMTGRVPVAPPSAMPKPINLQTQDQPLSFAQERVWTLENMMDMGTTYSVPGAYSLTGPLDVTRLEKALNAVVQKHTGLSTVFEEKDGNAVQHLLPPSKINLTAEPVAHKDVDATLRQLANIRFDLCKGPLMRFHLLETGPNEHILMMVLHHLICDGWSVDILLRNLADAYIGKELDTPRLSYGDFTVWQKEQLSGEYRDILNAFWKNELADVPILDLPLDRPRPPVPSNQGDHVPISIPLEGINRFCKDFEATSFMVCIAIFAALLHRYSNQDDFAIGTPVSGRHHPGVEDVVGFFADNLVIRTPVDSENSFAELLAKVRQRILSAFDHQDLPFVRLLDAVNPNRRLDITPLFQVTLTVDDGMDFDLTVEGLQASPIDLALPWAKYDLGINLRTDPKTKQLAGYLEYNSDIFTEQSATNLARHFETLAGAVARSPDMPISRLDLRNGDTSAASELTGRMIDHPFEGGLHQLIRAQTLRSPDATALITSDESEKITYSGLEYRSGVVADQIRKAGIKPGNCIGVHCHRSINLPIILLGILKAGCAYVPLNQAHPVERLSLVMQTAKPAAIITDGTIPDALNVKMLIKLADLISACLANTDQEIVSENVAPDDPAVILFTSGSTGIPKGVTIPHRAICNHAHWFIDTTGLGPNDTIALNTSFDFDASLIELFTTFVAGATLVVPVTKRNDDILAVCDAISNHKVTVMQAVPSLYRVMLSDGLLSSASSLRLVLSGGEALPKSLADALKSALPGARILNCYGPTETCIDALCHEYKGSSQNTLVPLGQPVDNTSITIVNAAGTPVPDGMPGELVITGLGMSLGYLHDADRTAQSFLPPDEDTKPTEQSVRPGFRYKTGDRARLGPDGVEYLGRMDAQLKVNGIRIEADEIEQALTGHPAIQDAAVTTVNDDLVAIITHVSTNDQPPLTADAVLSKIRERLPASITITHLVAVRSIPRLSSGKIDRRRIQQIANSHIDQRTQSHQDTHPLDAPEGLVEETLFDIWKEVLGQDGFGRTDNFFAVGGQSLRAVQVVARIRNRLNANVSVQDIFECATISLLAERIGNTKNADTPDQNSLTAHRRNDFTADGSAIIPVSYAQRSLWFLDQLEGGSAAYTTISAFLIEGDVYPAIIAETLNAILARHETLRTRFGIIAIEPVQIVTNEATFPFVIHSETLKDDRDQLCQTAKIATAKLFNLGTDLPVRFELWPLSSGRHFGLLCWHHIATDGWSQGVFITEFATLYQAFREGKNARGAALPELPFQYGDYALWQQERLSDTDFQDKRTYWRHALEGAPQSLSLFADRSRPARQSFKGATHRFQLSAKQTERARKLGEASSITLYMLGLAVFLVLLNRWSRQHDILVGTPVANRPNADTEKLIGYFVNTVVTRGKIDLAQPFGELLTDMRDIVLNAFANQEVPFEQLVEDLSPDRHLDHSPLFQVMFNLQNHETTNLVVPGLRLEEFEFDTGTAKFDINLTLIEKPDAGLDGHWEYATDLFDPATAVCMADQYQMLFDQVLAEPDTPVGKLALMDEAQTKNVHRLIDAVAKPAFEPAANNILLHMLVEQQVNKSPDVIAVEAGDTRMSYRELDNRANALARTVQTRGALPGDMIGIDLGRSAEMIIALLAVLKAGCAYVPLDRTLPKSRITNIIADAKLRILISDQDGEAAYAGIGKVVVINDETMSDAPLHPFVMDAEYPVYQLYTSGSTGKPKGVQMPHRALVNLMQWQLGDPNFYPSARTLQFTTLGFDVASQEIFTTLCGGGTLVMMPAELRQDMPRLLSYTAQNKVERLFMPFTALQQIAEAWPLAAKQPKALREIITAGEQLRITPTIRMLFKALPKCTLTNQYGPTETHVVSAHTLQGTCDTWPEFPPIGSPVANTALYVLDDDGQLLPPNMPGQLWVGGKAVGNGYPGQPDLTEKLFRPDPFGKTGRIYATGDLARMRIGHDQTIWYEYLGRVDQQLKIRGYRIEPAEIELALTGLDEIRDAAVIAWSDSTGEKRLVAYYVASSPTDDDSEISRQLRTKLAKVLPEYMVPTVWIKLDALPQTPSGKISRQDLPTPVRSSVPNKATSSRHLPISETAQKLASIWSSVLECSTVGLHDNFFDLGGYSFLMLRVLAEIHQQFPDANHIAMVNLFEHPTVSSLATLIDQGPADAPSRHRAEERKSRMRKISIRRAARSRTSAKGESDLS